MTKAYFISFSSFDGKGAATRIQKALEGSRPPHRVWLYSDEVRPGEYWAKGAGEAIKACGAVLFVMTPDSVEVESECENEWRRALRYKKPIVPLLFDSGAEPPLSLEKPQQIDFTGDFESALSRLRDHLLFLESPEGILEGLQTQLGKTRYDRQREKDETKHERQERDISDLERRIARQEQIILDPDAAAEKVENSIRRGIELEQNDKDPGASESHTKFINPPPTVAPTYFQDRISETRLITDFLKEDASRLFTVVGRGGVGKTVLVCRLLKAIESARMPDGLDPFLVEGIVYLSAAGSHGVTAENIFFDLCKLLPEAKSKELGDIYMNPHLGIREKMISLTEAFSEGRVVVLLDNFEDVVNAEKGEISFPDLNELLKALLDAPQHSIKVVITTRVIPRELAMVQPARQMTHHLDEGLSSPFAENILREMDRDGRIGLRDASDELLKAARERTGGNPRALEALFAILSADRESSVEEILADTEKLLPENVVEVLVGEAFCRLEPDAQRVMEALAIYSRPVSPVAVDYLLQPYVPTTDCAPVLGRLVNMHFVRKEAEKYFLHPIDTAYALSRVDKGTVEDRLIAEDPPWSQYALWNRAAKYFKEVGKPQHKWKSLQDLEPYLSEFDMHVRGHNYLPAMEVLLGFDWKCLFPWGHYQLLIDLHERVPIDKISGVHLGQSLTTLGSAYAKMGKAYKAIEFQTKSLEVWKENGYAGQEAAALNNLGLRDVELGRTTDAIEKLKKTEEIELRIGDIGGLSTTLKNLGVCYTSHGEASQAIKCFEKSLEIARRFGAKRNEALALEKMGHLLADEDRLDEAQKQFQDALKIAKEENFVQVLHWALWGIAQAQLMGDDLDAAHATAEEALEYDVPENNYRAWTLLGIIRLLRGSNAESIHALETGVKKADELLKNCNELFAAHDSRGLALAGLAIHDELGESGLAREAFRTARALNSDPGIIRRNLQTLELLAPLDSRNLLKEILPDAGDISPS